MVPFVLQMLCWIFSYVGFFSTGSVILPSSQNAAHTVLPEQQHGWDKSKRRKLEWQYFMLPVASKSFIKSNPSPNCAFLPRLRLYFPQCPSSRKEALSQSDSGKVAGFALVVWIICCMQRGKRWETERVPQASSVLQQYAKTHLQMRHCTKQQQPHPKAFMFHISKTAAECRHSSMTCPMMKSGTKPSPLQQQASLPAIIKSSQARRPHSRLPARQRVQRCFPPFAHGSWVLLLLAPDPLPAWAPKASQTGEPNSVVYNANSAPAIRGCCWKSSCRPLYRRVLGNAEGGRSLSEACQVFKQV